MPEPRKTRFFVCANCADKKCVLKKMIAKNQSTLKKVFLYRHILPSFVPGDSLAEVKECETADDCAHSVCTPIKYGRLSSRRKTLVNFIGNAPHGNDYHGQKDFPLRGWFCSHSECNPKRQSCKADAMH